MKKQWIALFLILSVILVGVVTKGFHKSPSEWFKSSEVSVTEGK